MWDLDGDYPTPRYLLWTGLALGGVMGLVSAGALIKGFTTEADTLNLVGVLGVILLMFLSFFLVLVTARELWSAPSHSPED